MGVVDASEQILAFACLGVSVNEAIPRYCSQRNVERQAVTELEHLCDLCINATGVWSICSVISRGQHLSEVQYPSHTHDREAESTDYPTPLQNETTSGFGGAFRIETRWSG